MFITLSDPMRRAIEATLRSKFGESRIVNVFGVAEEVQLRFIDDNVALEDIAAVVAQLAAQSGCALELDRGNNF
ncbi:MAG TPA: hypothetical protein VGN91_06490 [Bosea sp. (in: a-proteobacteria)]|jgi:hypothetical protein|nr:hypothetical protein [Bosea sp. (in: a-proteobacteria)]